MRTVRLALLAVLVAVVFGALASPASARHAPWRWKNDAVVYESRWPVVWRVRVGYGFRYNFHTVQLTWITCSTWGWGFDVDVKWCGAWNSGLPFGGDWMDVGANFRVSFMWRGFPVARDFWVREAVSRQGIVCCVRRGGG